MNGTHIGTYSVPDDKSDGKPREKLDEEGELRVLASEGLTPFLVSSLNVRLPVSLRASTWFVWNDCSSNGSSWSSGCHERQEEKKVNAQVEMKDANNGSNDPGMGRVMKLRHLAMTIRT